MDNLTELPSPAAPSINVEAADHDKTTKLPPVGLLSFHPIADVFPMMEGVDFEQLVNDILHNGLIEPITIYEQKVLDGRNRYRACLKAGVTPEFDFYSGGDPVGFAFSRNLLRRHLNESQRSMVAAKLVPLLQVKLAASNPAASTESETETAASSTAIPNRANLRGTKKKATRQAAAALNVSERNVETAIRVQEHGSPAQIVAVEQGRRRVSAVEKELGAAADNETLSIISALSDDPVPQGAGSVLEEEAVINAYSLREADDSAPVPVYPALARPLADDEQMIFLGDPGYHFDSADRKLLIDDFERRLLPLQLQIKDHQTAISKLRQAAKSWEAAVKVMENGGTPFFVVTKKKITESTPTEDADVKGAA